MYQYPEVLQYVIWDVWFPATKTTRHAKKQEGLTQTLGENQAKKLPTRETMCQVHQRKTKVAVVNIWQK